MIHTHQSGECRVPCVRDFTCLRKRLPRAADTALSITSSDITSFGLPTLPCPSNMRQPILPCPSLHPICFRKRRSLLRGPAKSWPGPPGYRRGAGSDGDTGHSTVRSRSGHGLCPDVPRMALQRGRGYQYNKMPGGDIRRGNCAVGSEYPAFCVCRRV